MSSDPSSSPLAALTDISIDKSFGTVLIGTFLGIALYGIILNQVYRYSRMYTSDRIELKIAVYATVVLETVHIALSCQTCYYYLVTGYFDPLLLEAPTRPMQFLPMMTGLIVGTAQCFFARRAYIFGRQYRIWVFLAVLSLLGESAFCIATTALNQSGSFDEFVSKTWLLACGSGLAVCADFILTTVLIIALRRSRSGVKRTDSTVDVLVLYTITTGFITSISMLSLFLVLVIIPSEVGIYTAISIVVTKLYANTLLAALNRRKSLKDRAAINIVGTDFVFGTEILEDDRARTTLPVAIEFHTITHSDAGSASAGTDSNKDIALQAMTIEKLGSEKPAHGMQGSAMNIC